MARPLLVVTHCSAAGQAPDAPLTHHGHEQAVKVANFVRTFYRPARVLSSPCRRAVQTAAPLAAVFDLVVSVDDRLAECQWSGTDALERSSADEDGHCRQATVRASSFLHDMKESSAEGQVTVVVSHGTFIDRLLDLLGPQTHTGVCKLASPDLFLVDLDMPASGSTCIHRLWSDEGEPVVKARPSARALLIHPSKQQIFLFLLSDPSVGTRLGCPMWITPGGGANDQEPLIDALSRELFEELGLAKGDYEVKGQLWRSFKNMAWHGIPRLFIDNYFVVLLSSLKQFNMDGQEEHERRVLKGHRWWSLQELKASDDLIIPPQLLALDSFEDILALGDTICTIEENV